MNGLPNALLSMREVTKDARNLVPQPILITYIESQRRSFDAGCHSIMAVRATLGRDDQRGWGE
jgi:hypothetical protein